jgi:hypothetical protein
VGNSIISNLEPGILKKKKVASVIALASDMVASCSSGKSPS